MGLRLLAIACLVGAAFAGPFQRQNRCASQCPTPSHEKFNYEPGNTYSYLYKGINYISIHGHPKQRVEIQGTAEIHVMTRCEMVLQLKDIKLEHKATEEENRELIRKLEIPLPFAFEDGKIDHVCPDSEESTQSENIKKGILSALINTMNRLDRPEFLKEEDSMGTCMTKYSVRGPLVEKEKNLKSCTNRHSAITSLITNPYESPDSNIHTLPVFPDEVLTCQQTIKNKVIESVGCSEVATLKPLKQQDSLIKFEGEIHLTLRRVDSTARRLSYSIDRESSIQYNLQEENKVEDRETEVENTLRRMCSKNIGVIDVSVSKDFFSLVSNVKRLDSESLERVYRSLESGRICSSKKVMDVFLDTLPMVGTEGAIKLMVKLLVEKKVTGLKAKLWTASLALVPNPSHEAMAAVVPLLKDQKSASVFLGVSAMVYRYCSRSQCEQSSAAREIVSELNRALGRQCSSDNENEAVAILKAFGNMGFIGEAESNILACAKDSEKSIRLRLAAVDAFRRTEKKRPDELLHMYSNTEEHFEIRIAALSSVLRNADIGQIEAIKVVAETEKDDQVAAYTSTLIDNMNKTSSPWKKEIRSLLQSIEINTKNVSYWENSKNIEVSAFSERFNIGSGVEANIIHSPESKIPRSVYNRFDIDIFDKHINIYEIGIRAEGLEEAMKKMIGFQEEKKQKSSWNFLRSSSKRDETESEASIFIRTMNTEIFDLSVSDLTGMGQMIKIADMLEKISHEKSADFSHSFLFLNSKLVIPSVTGRSYSFGLTGSATVGLTASSKVDIVNLMSTPRNCDVHGRFQPSVNVEIAATVGIQSNEPRPDLKLVTRLHSESDIEATFRIRDGHLALASVNMPSENILLTKISSDIVEVDVHHSEKRLYQNMQKKIDYCFNKLEKPLGVSLCGKLEVPRPFISKTFPFVKGVGNIEFSIKKTDVSMKGFELSFEIPKHKSPVMKYKSSLDTPGSRVNRRFAIELELRNQPTGQNELTLLMESPFKSASAKGSFTLRDDLAQAYMELISSSSRKYYINATSPISSSGSQKIYRPSIQISLPSSSQPLKVGGTIAVMKGRKQQLSFDIKSNQPVRKPLAIKGILVKEGHLNMSKNAEWKMSSDVAMKTPWGAAQIRNSVGKQAKQSETISTLLTVDYQRPRSQKHSIKLTGKVQRSSGKISSSVQCEMTQFSVANWDLTWNMQGKLPESLKNDITLNYGKEPERHSINILQSAQLLSSGPAECKVAVKAPQFDIDSELRFIHEIRANSKIYVEADVMDKSKKYSRGLIHWEKLSMTPLKMKVKTELELPSRKLSYEDEIQEVSPNTYEGNAVLQWQKDKKAELKYKYHKSNSPSNMRQEFETNLRLPNSRSPIKNKAVLQMSEENLAIEARLTLDRSAEYFVNADLNKRGASQLSLKLPKLEGNVKVFNENQKKAVALDLKSKLYNRARRIVMSTNVGLGDKKKIEAEIQWDADRNPNNKAYLSSDIETVKRSSGSTYSTSSKLKVSKYVNLELTGSGDASIYGSHQFAMEASVLDWQPCGVVMRHEMNKQNSKTSIRLSENHVEKAELSLGATFHKRLEETELKTSVSLKSLDNSFQNKEWTSHEFLSWVGSSVTFKSSARLQWAPNKVYESELNYDLQPNMMTMKGYLLTPHYRFEKQAVGFSFRRTGSTVATSATIEFSNGNVISISSETQRKEDGMSAVLSISSPYKFLKDVKMQVSYEKQRSSSSVTHKSNFQLQVSPNKIYETELVYEVQPNVLLMKASLHTPHIKFEKQAVGFTFRRSQGLISSTTTVELSNGKVISISSDAERKEGRLSATVTVTSPFEIARESKWQFLYEKRRPKTSISSYLEVNRERHIEVEANVMSSSRSTEINGRMKTSLTPEVSAQIILVKESDSFKYSAQIMKGSATMLSTSVEKRASRGEFSYSLQTKSLEQTFVDVKLVKSVSLEGTTHSLEAKGPFSPIHVELKSEKKDRDSMNVGLTACRQYEYKTCYSVKVYHKVLVNQQNYKLYRKLSVDVEKSSENSKEEHMASGNFIVAIGDHDYKEKVLIEANGKSYGYDVKFHRRENEDDDCTLDCQIYMPHRTIRIKGSAHHTEDHLLVGFEVLPDSSVPSRKLSLELKEDYSKESKEASGHIHMIYPGMSKPIELSGHLKREGMLPISGKLELDYSSSKGKVLKLEIFPDLESTETGKRVLLYRLYSEDQSVDMTLKLLHHKARDQDTYGYNWVLKSPQGQKTGGVKIQLSEKKSGIPQALEVSLYTPSVDLKLRGRTVWTSTIPSEISLSLLSKSQRLYDIEVKAKDRCISVEQLLKSGPFLKSELCATKMEDGIQKVLDIESYYRNHPCLHFNMYLDPEKSHLATIALKWDKKDFQKASREMNELISELREEHLGHFEDEILDNIKEYLIEAKEVLRTLVKDIWHHLRLKASYHTRKLRAGMERIRSMEIKYFPIWDLLKRFLPIDYINQEIIMPVVEGFICLAHKYAQYAYEQIPELVRILWEFTQVQLQECFQRYCTANTFCHEVLQTYKRHGVAPASRLAYQKMCALKSAAVKKLWKIKALPDFSALIQSVVEKIKSLLKNTFGAFLEQRIFEEIVHLAMRIEEIIRDKTIYYIDLIIKKVNEIFRHVEKDEDYRVLKALVTDTKEKAVRAWGRKEALIKEAWIPLKEALLEEFPRRWVREKLNIQEFNPKEGSVQIQFHHPLESKHIEVLKNAIWAIKNKIASRN